MHSKKNCKKTYIWELQRLFVQWYNLLKTQQRFKSDYHEVHTEEVNKIALTSNDDKILQTLDNTTTYPHGTNASKVRENEMMMLRDLFVENYADLLYYDEIVLQPQQRIKGVNRTSR